VKTTQKPTAKKNVRRRLFVAFFLSISLWMAAWVAALGLIVDAPLNHADAIVLLSGSSTLRERATQAAELYQQGRASKIILTNDGGQGGWSQSEQRNPAFYELTIVALRGSGVPESAIEVQHELVASTHDEAVLLKRVSEQERLTSVLLVTSAYHSRRALWTFKRVFRDTKVNVGVSPVPTGIQTPKPKWWWLHVRGWTTVPAEYTKIIVYRFRY
jgi:uncharacterized SAM-binding protein YcdF (DUF218 family)